MGLSLYRFVRFLALLTFVLVTLALLHTQLARAELNTKNALVTLAPIGGAKSVEMDAQIFDVNVSDSNEGVALNGTLTFKLHNTDKLSKTTLLVGFPTWGGGSVELNDKNFSQFDISADKKPIQADWQTLPLKIGNETRTVRWLTFPVNLDEDERASVQVAFQLHLGADPLPTIVIAQAPAILWKNYVGSARFSIHFPSVTTPEQFRYSAPVASTFDGKVLTWTYEQYNPDAPIVLQIVKPRIWREIVADRAALAQGANAAAALSLGRQFVTLARATQSASDYAQAIAALQSAGEMDLSAVQPPLELAKLYESKLRGELGAVGDENALRTAALQQWQRVLQLSPSSSDARDAVAQHAFVLAQLARRSRHYDAALKLLDSARAANSSKVTPAQLDGELRANRAGFAVQQMDAGQWIDVLASMESGSLGADAQLEMKNFQPRFTSVQARISIEDERQQIDLRIVPFPRPSAQHEQWLKQWLNNLARQLDATPLLNGDGEAYTISVNAPLRLLSRNDSSLPLELTMVRDALTPSDLRITHVDNVFTGDDSFHAQYTFSESQRVAQGKLDEIERASSALRTPSNDETAELIRRVRTGALDFYKTGWQSLLGSSAHITWRDSPLDPNPPTWELRAGDVKQLQAQRTTYEPAPIIGGACAALLIVAVVVWGVWFVSKRRVPKVQWN